MQLITYANRFGADLSELQQLLNGELAKAFDGVHILPFFEFMDGADAGFDPEDHTRVDGRVGSWSNIGSIARRHHVMADLIVNHVSSRSVQFQHVLAHGEASPYWSLFLRRRDVFSDALSADEVAENLGRLFRPRPTEPFSEYVLNSGQRELFWTTFSDHQIDINVESECGIEYLDSILATFAKAGIRQIRLDAAGFAIKRPGTSCFLLPETFSFIGSLEAKARKLGMQTLVEVHTHHRNQIELARHVDRVYDFALPPLVLHALYEHNVAPLKKWLSMSPRNCVTVLDTHDGIGILDIGPAEGEPGLLDNAQLDRLVEQIHQKTGGSSRAASGEAASNLDIYQVNTTYYEALGRDDTDYLIARAIQFFCPGEPQVYYVGLLAGHNDMELVSRTGVGRDINRHSYSLAEVRSDLQRPVVKNLLALAVLRNQTRAFAGDFSLLDSSDQRLCLRWDNADSTALLDVDLAQKKADILIDEDAERAHYRIDLHGFVRADDPSFITRGA